MKRSKSSQPILNKSVQNLPRQRSFIGEREKNKQFGKQKSIDVSNAKLDKVLAEAEESFEKADYENALLKFSQGAAIKPNHEEFTLGIRKSRIAILNDFKNSGDNVRILRHELSGYEDKIPDNLITDPKNLEHFNYIPKLSTRSECTESGDYKSETAKSLSAKYKQKSSEQLYNLRIHDGTKYKIVSATTQDLKEYMKDKNYFKMKERTAEEWKKLRREMNKKIAEKEAIEKYEKEAKLLEEKSNIRHYCDEQITLIGRYYQNNKIPDVIRFSENFIKYLNKKADKLLPRKWIYMAAAFNYLGRAFIEQENFEKAKVFGEKLYKIAVSSNNTELLCQSYILSGKIYVKFGKFEEAAFVWEKLIPLIENKEKKAWLFHEIGRCYFEMKKYDVGYKHGTDSAFWAEQCGSEKWLCSANVLQGQCEMKRNNYINALQKFLEAKKHAELCNDESIIKYVQSVEEVLSQAVKKKKTGNDAHDDENTINKLNR